MSFWDRFYAGERSYSIPFILLFGGMGIVVSLGIIWAVGETVDHFIP